MKIFNQNIEAICWNITIILPIHVHFCRILLSCWFPYWNPTLFLANLLYFFLSIMLIRLIMFNNWWMTIWDHNELGHVEGKITKTALILGIFIFTPCFVKLTLYLYCCFLLRQIHNIQNKNMFMFGIVNSPFTNFNIYKPTSIPLRTWVQNKSNITYNNTNII